MVNMARRRRRWQRLWRYLARTVFDQRGPILPASNAVKRMWREQDAAQARREAR